MSKFHRTLLHQITSGVGDSHEKERKPKIKPKEEEEEERGGQRVGRLEETSILDVHESSPGRDEWKDNSTPSPTRSKDNLGSGQDKGEEIDSVVGSSSDSQLLDKELDSRKSGEVAESAKGPPIVDKEERRKISAAKRTNEQTLGSAKERYLARKRAKLSAPVISSDD